MTGPRLPDLDNYFPTNKVQTPVDRAAQLATPKIPDLDNYFPENADKQPAQEDEKPMGFFKYIFNTLHGIDNYLVASKARPEDLIKWTLDSQSEKSYVADQAKGYLEAYAAYKAPKSSFDVTKRDFLDIFGHLITMPFDAAVAAGENLGAMTKEAQSAPFAMAGQIAKGFIEPVGDLYEATGGVVFDPNGMRVATPEERSAKTKNAVAAAVTFAAGYGMAKGIGMIGRAESLEKMGMKGLVEASKQSGSFTELYMNGTVGKNIVKNGVIGYTGGLVYGAVRFAGEDDQLAQTLTMGLLGGTLGGAHSLLSATPLPIVGKSMKKATLARANAAYDLANTRQLQALANESVHNGIKMMEAFKDADGVADAVFTGSVAIDNPVIVHGVSKAKISEVMGKGVAKNLFVVQHENPDGTISFLASPRGKLGFLSGRGKFFEDHGFFQNQLVAHDGAQWELVDDAGRITTEEVKVRNAIFQEKNPDGTPKFKLQTEANAEFGRRSGALDRYKIRDPKTGTIKVVRRSEISHLTGIEMADPIIELTSTERLKSRALRERGTKAWTGGTLPIEQETKAALAGAKTGQPLSVIGFRGVRGEKIPLTGVHYGGNIDQALGYAESIVTKHMFDYANWTTTGTGKDIPLVARNIANVKDAMQKLLVHRLNFQNPFVITSRQTGLLEMMLGNQNFPVTTETRNMLSSLKMTPKELSEAQTILNYFHKTSGETGYGVADRFLARLFKSRGYDGIVYAERAGHPPEIIDLRGKTMLDIPEEVKSKVFKFGVAEEKGIIRKFYENWKDSLVGEKPSDLELYNRSATLQPIDLTLPELNAHKNFHIEQLRQATERLKGAVDPTERSSEEAIMKYREEYVTVVDAEIAKRVADPTVPRFGNAPKDKVIEGERAQKQKIVQLHDKITNFNTRLASQADFIMATERNLSTYGKPGEPVYDQIANRLKNRKMEFEHTKKELADIETELATINNDEGVRSFIDWVPPENFSFAKSVAQFAKSRGFSEGDFQSIKKLFEKELHDDFKNGDMEPEDVAVLENVRKKMVESQALEAENISKSRSMAAEDLSRVANQNGMYISVEDNGHLAIRDAESHDMLHRAASYNEARVFIRDSATSKGVNLDADFALPPTNGDLYRAPPMFPEDSHPFGRNGKMSQWLDSANMTATLFSEYRDIFQAFDSKYGTQFFAKLYDSTQAAKRMSNAKQMPWMVRLDQRIDKLMRTMGRGDRQIVFQYADARSPEEIKSGYKSARPLTSVEVALGERLGADKVDLEKVFKFKEQVRLIMKNLKGKPLEGEVPGGQDKILEARQAMNVNDAEFAAYEMFEEVEQMNLREASIGNITNLARAIQQGSVKQSEFRVKHNMTDNQIKAANELMEIHRELAKEFGIPDDRPISNIMTHARLYTQGNIARAVEHFSGDTAGKEFYKKMAKTGEINSHELDPIKATARFIKAGFDAKYMGEEIAQAKKFVTDELINPKLDKNVRQSLEKIVDRYISDIQGHPDAEVRATQAIVDRTFEDHGWKNSPDVRKNIVNAILSTGEAAAQGLKVIAGIRDFFTQTVIINARFSSKYMTEVFEFGVKGLDGMDTKKLQAAGILTEPSVVQFADPSEIANSVFGTGGKFSRGVAKFNNILFAGSGQKKVYEILQTGNYLATKRRVGLYAAELNAGKITKEKFYSKLKLDTYREPVIREFESRFRANQEDAASWLGIQTVAETQKTYGLANHPPGWGTNIGRIAGQFGGWSNWYRSALGQMMSRGTVGQRLGAISKLAVSHAIAFIAADQLGFDILSWNPLSGIVPGAGPLIEAAEDLGNLTSSNAFIRNQGLGRLRRWLVYDPGNDEIDLGIIKIPQSPERFTPNQLYIPMSYAVKDWIKAYHLAQNGYNPVAVVGQAMGFRVDTTERSRLDDMMGFSPALER